MWLVNDEGFCSTVADWDDSDWLYVRGRSETDIEAFINGVSLMAVEHSWEPALEHTPDRDYAWRVHVPRVIWGGYLLKKSEELDYGNFKSHCSEKWNSEDRDFSYERLQLLHDAWMLFNHWPDSQL